MTANLPIPYDPEFAAWQALSGYAMKFELVGAFEVLDRLNELVGPTVLGDDYWDCIVDPIYGRAIHFDRQGNPITMRRWGELREVGLDPDGHYGKNSYVRVGEDTLVLPNGDTVAVSTVWLGHDHGFPMPDELDGGGYRPVIFETMIFGGQYSDYLRRYCTEAEAAQGHREAVEDLRIGMKPWWSHGGEEEDEWRFPGDGGGDAGEDVDG